MRGVGLMVGSALIPAQLVQMFLVGGYMKMMLWGKETCFGVDGNYKVGDVIHGGRLPVGRQEQ